MVFRHNQKLQNIKLKERKNIYKNRMGAFAIFKTKTDPPNILPNTAANTVHLEYK